MHAHTYAKLCMSTAHTHVTAYPCMCSQS